MWIRKYVDVVAYCDEDGKVTPMYMIWEDGRKFEIDYILDIRRAASQKAGSLGLRYTVRILGKERYLFLQDDHRWFVEQEVSDTK